LISRDLGVSFSTVKTPCYFNEIIINPENPQMFIALSYILDSVSNPDDVC
jgi:hypothetical protein